MIEFSSTSEPSHDIVKGHDIFNHAEVIQDYSSLSKAATTSFDCAENAKEKKVLEQDLASKVFVSHYQSPHIVRV